MQCKKLAPEVMGSMSSRGHSAGMSKQQMKFFLRSSKHSILSLPEAKFLNLSAGSIVLLLFPTSGYMEESTQLCGLGQQQAHGQGLDPRWVHVSAPEEELQGLPLHTLSMEQQKRTSVFVVK